MRRLAAVAAGLLLSCIPARARPLLICHNANCAQPATADRDDTIDGLRRSLDLRLQDGRPPFDGVEIDTVWDASRRRCVFAHAPSASEQPLASAAAALIADHLAAPLPAAFNRRRFFVKIELKTEVLPSGRTHTDDEAFAHAACALELLGTLAAAAHAGAVELTIIYDSDDPWLLRAIVHHPAWRRPRPGAGVRVELEVNFDAMLPGDLEPDILTVYMAQIEPAVRAAVADRGKAVLVWGRFPSEEALAAIDYLGADFVGTNDILLARAYFGD